MYFFMTNQFDIPVTMFLFKRKDSSIKIINKISKIKPRKIYLLADCGRNPEEQQLVENCRKAVEKAIDWDCKIIKNYAQTNRGVYRNIGDGAKWVLSNEPCAIFLEDDNLPEISFFYYCQELLKKYKNNEKILWICGTNYLGQYNSPTGTSYMFTQHLLPCGWASWSNKFLKYYDGLLYGLENNDKINKFKESYSVKALYKQQQYSINRTKYLLQTDPKKSSWDYQMLFSVRANGLYGISPCKNQIKNIGIDIFSEHGGNNINITMTKRFCGMDSYELNFPLVHPQDVEIDRKYEDLISKIILIPWIDRIKRSIATLIKNITGMDPYDSMLEKIRKYKNDKIF